MEDHMGGNHRSNGGRGSDNWDLGAVVRFASSGPSSPTTNDDRFSRFVPPPPPTNNPFASFPLHQPLSQLHQVPNAMEWQLAPNLPLPTDLVTVGGGGFGQAISTAPPPQPEDMSESQECKEKVVLWESPLTVDDLFQESFDSKECNEKEKMVLWECPVTVDDIFQELFDSQKPPQVHPAAPQPSLPAPAPAPVPSVKLAAAGDDSPLPVPKKTAPSSGAAAAGSSRRRTKRRKKDMKVTRVRNGQLRLDSWTWRKYGEKPMKGSEYLRSYYKCTSDKECTARRYVDRCDADPNGHIVSYEGEHCHPMPALVRKGRTAGVKKNKPLPLPSAPPPVKIPAVAQAPAPPASAMASPSPTTPPLPAVVKTPALPPSATTVSLWDTPPAPSLRAFASASAPSQFLKIPAAEEKRQAPAPLASFASAWLSATMPLRATSVEFDGGDLITLGKLSDDAGMKKTSEDSVLIVISDDEDEDQDDLVVPTPEELAPVYCNDVEENMKFPMAYELETGSNACNNDNNLFEPAPGSGGGGKNNNLMLLMSYEPAPSSSGGGDGNTSTDVSAGKAPVPAPMMANVADDETLLFNPWGLWA